MSLIVIDGPTIAAGDALSDAIDATAGYPVRIKTPADWTPANLSFQVSPDGMTFDDLLDSNGREILVAAPANAKVHVPEEWPNSGGYFRFRSGSRTRPVTQQAARQFAVTLETATGGGGGGDGIEEAPLDGILYGRRNAVWSPVVVPIGPLPPTNLRPGQLWWRNDPDGNLYIYYFDGITAQWVPASSAAGGGAGGGGIGEAPSDNKLYGRLNRAWREILADVDKAYVDQQDALRILKAGDVMTGALSIFPPTGATLLTLDGTDNTQQRSLLWRQNGQARFSFNLESDLASELRLRAHGPDRDILRFDRVSGLAEVVGEPVGANGIATKAYVDRQMTGTAGVLVGIMNAASGFCQFTVASGIPSPGVLPDPSPDLARDYVVVDQPGTPPIGPIQEPLQHGDIVYCDGSDWIRIPIGGAITTASSVVVAPPVFGKENVQDALAESEIRIDDKIDKSGDSMTGLLTLSGPPIADLHAATKAYVDGSFGQRHAIFNFRTRSGWYRLARFRGVGSCAFTLNTAGYQATSLRTCILAWTGQHMELQVTALTGYANHLQRFALYNGNQYGEQILQVEILNNNVDGYFEVGWEVTDMPGFQPAVFEPQVTEIDAPIGTIYNFADERVVDIALGDTRYVRIVDFNALNDSVANLTAEVQRLQTQVDALSG